MKYIIGFFILFSPFFSSAQVKNSLWVEYYPDINLHGGKWKLSPEVSYRSDDFSGAHTVYFRPQATYKINNTFSVTGALAYFVSWDDFAVNEREFSAYQAVTAKSPSLGRFSMALRARFEQMFVKAEPETSYNFGFRMRFMPSVTYLLPVMEEKGLALTAFMETFTFPSASHRDYYDNGVSFGGKFSFSPVEKLKIELEYHRYIAHKEIGDANSNRFRIMIRHSRL